MIGKTISHYKIIDKLGEGGMGVVYLAEDTNLERQVAIKFLPHHISDNSDERKRFEIEAKAAAALNHPNISHIYSIEEVDNEMFIVMEYIDGMELKKRLKSGPLSIDETKYIATQIAEGLQAAHKKGIIHRDIKSSNIMITEDGKVKIMDFGLVKVGAGIQLTKEHSTLGTAAYMSPEQVRGEDVDQRSDIWSFGVLLYEMSAGQLPFTGDYDQAIFYSILNEDLIELSSVRSGLPLELEQIINKCLEKKSFHRYQGVDELIVDLRRLKELSSKKTPHIKPEISETKKKSHLFISSLIVSILVCITILYFVFFKTPEEVSSFAERKMLVVLPFKNLGLPEDEYFADGITEEITSRLSEIKQLGIIGRTSADLYKNTEKSIDQIGEELGVDYLLEGSVRWEKILDSESRIRVTPQLIKVSDGTHIWTKRYDAILASVFDVQTDIAEKVADALNITLLGTEQESISQKPTDNLEAYDYYLRGKDYFQRGYVEENYRIAEQMFQKAVELDTNFAIAYAGLAQVNTEMYFFYWDRNKNRLSKSKLYIEKALQITTTLPEAYLAFGQYYYHGFLDYEKALFELERGLKIKPDFSEILTVIGFVKRRQGNFEEAISYLEKSIELDPLSKVLNNEIGVTYFLLKQYEEAEKYLDKSISIIPEWGEPYAWRAKLYIYNNGDVDKAYKILKNNLDIVTQEKKNVVSFLPQVQIFSRKYEEALKTLSDESWEVFDDQFTFLPKSQLLAIIYGLKNNKSLEKAYYDSARIVIQSELEKLPDDARLHSALGIAFAGLGKKEEAINEGKLAVELLPVTKEAWRGFTRELDLAKIYTMVGKYDLAIDKLEYLLSIPGQLSVPYIKLDPVWQPLVKIPRFQKILEENK